MTLALNPSSTAFLFMDFQNGIVARMPEQSEALLKRARSVLDGARASGSLVTFVRVAFRPGYPEVNERNATMSAAKKNGMMRIDAPETAITPLLAPLETEPVVVKHRVGAFSGTDLEVILRAHQTDTLVLLGISTSGCVLSTVRYAADSDYRIVVASDGCADPDAEVHRVLMERVFPRQATIATTAEIVLALAGSASR